MDMISYNQALKLTLDNISQTGAELVGILAAVGQIAADELLAFVDSPTVDVSLKDGYAIQSQDIAAATEQNPVYLRLVGEVAAGGQWHGDVKTGQALRILSGAPLPNGATAVVSEEFARRNGDTVENQ